MFIIMLNKIVRLMIKIFSILIFEIFVQNFEGHFLIFLNDLKIKLPLCIEPSQFFFGTKEDKS